MLKNKKGSIFLNLLVAVLIIMLTVTISIPYIRNFRINSELSAEARTLANNLRYVQQLSVTQQVVHGVHFDPENNYYEILRIGSSTSTLETVFLKQNIDFKEVNGFPQNLVKFNFYGGAIEAGEIVLGNINNREITLRVKPSGYVQIK